MVCRSVRFARARRVGLVSAAVVVVSALLAGTALSAGDDLRLRLTPRGTVLARAFALRPADLPAGVSFPFKTASAAAAWVRGYASAIPKPALEPGTTGPVATFGLTEGTHELESSAGKYAADVACFNSLAPDRTSRACEAKTRAVAQLWYRALAVKSPASSRSWRA